MPGGQVTASRVSPDNSLVVYLADQDTDNTRELYSVPLGGGLVSKLTEPFAPDRGLQNFALSPDSRFFVYTADRNNPLLDDLFGVPIGGGANLKLNGDLVPGGEVLTFQHSGNFSRIVYHANQDTLEVDELYSLSTAELTGLDLIYANGFERSHNHARSNHQPCVAVQQRSNRTQSLISHRVTGANSIHRALYARLMRNLSRVKHNREN